MTKLNWHGSLLRVLSGCGRLDSNQRSSPYEGDEIGLFSTPRGCGGRTRTCDLQFMRLTSYQLLHPAVYRGSVFRSDPTTAPKWKETKIIEVIGKADNYITRSCFEPLLRGTSSLAIRYWCMLTDASGAWSRNRTSATWIFSPLLYLLSYPSILCGPPLSRTGIDPQQIYFASLYFYKAFSTKPHIGLRSSFVASAGGSLICEIHVNALV